MDTPKHLADIKKLGEKFEVELGSPDDIVVALAGNPNTGKSTIFNRLTGLNQHTGNWPGKTVANAQGKYSHNEDQYILVDLPGTYSLLANSVEEEIARDFICFGQPHATVVVTDATSLERNLNLVLQIMEITDRVLVCVNLMDEAERKGVCINLKKLQEILGVPVVATVARSGQGLDELKNTIEDLAKGRIRTNPKKLVYDEFLEDAVGEIQAPVENLMIGGINSRWAALRLISRDDKLLDSINQYTNFDLSHDELLNRQIEITRKKLKEKGLELGDIRDDIVSRIVETGEGISRQAIHLKNEDYNAVDRKIDRILTSRKFGIPIMIALLGLIFWITIEAANLPSELLARALFWFEAKLSHGFTLVNAPVWLHDMLILGVYRTLAWVISVMLPPMAIFFPLFTLLEDLGYLPRIAFNLDYYFKKSGTQGKQALTMCMGFGCNAAGVTSCRIIDSPRERLIAIITNNFVPCNGRFPILISLASIFILGSGGIFRSIIPTLSVLAAIILGVVITLLVSRLLSRTILKGLPSSFVLELPPYRKPQLGKIILRSIFDRTLLILGRAIVVAAPAGLVIWAMANFLIDDVSLLAYCAQYLDSFAQLLGMDGYILMAFILGLPANEIVIPILIMAYMSKGYMLELNSLAEMKELFINNGWTWLTAVSTMLFALNHWPCGTTLLTIRQETQSWKWTLVSFLLPTLTGIIVCFIVAQSVKFLGLI